MVTHDFSRPTVRVSVILGGNSHTVDLPADRIGDAVTAFEDHHAGTMTPERCIEVAAAAAGDGDAHLVAAASLWLWLFHPVDGEINAGRLGGMIASNGSALLTAQVCERSGAWTHRLFAMPRLPGTVRPYQRTKRDLRRRWT